jgi:hypothetical protein
MTTRRKARSKRRQTNKHKLETNDNMPFASPNEGVTVIHNIPPIIWMSLNIYPEVTRLFGNMGRRYIAQSSQVIISETGVLRVIEYSKRVHVPMVRDGLEHTTKMFETYEYLAYSLLKYSRMDGADNIFYEYLVGTCCTNNLSMRFPIFITTHDIYLMNASLMKRLRRKGTISGKDIQDNIHPFISRSIDAACPNHDKLGLIIQYCHNLINLSEITSIPNYKTELALILFQIYYALSQCKHIFTHYDLHDDNCGIIPLPGKSCLIYEYHLQDSSGIDRVVQFRSRYIVKIFDYGKSYFSGTSPNGKRITSNELFKKVSNAKVCSPPTDYGFGTFPDLYIDTPKVNHSHDLRLIYMLKSTCRKIPELAELADAVRYKTYYGTPGIEPSNTSVINTVGDASRVLTDIITRHNTETGMSIASKSIDMYSDHDVIGTLHVIGLTSLMRFDHNPKYKYNR